MKKLFLILIAIVGFTMVTLAQPRAIGGRLGWSLEGSYQHAVSGSNYFQIDAGLINYYAGVQTTGTYNWIFATPDWSDGWGKWEWFAGVGASAGFNWFLGNSHWTGFSNYNYSNSDTHFFTGVAGNIGLSFTFPFKLQLSLEHRPILGVSFGEYYDRSGNRRFAAFYMPGLYETISAVSVRYAF